MDNYENLISLCHGIFGIHMIEMEKRDTKHEWRIGIGLKDFRDCSCGETWSSLGVGEGGAVFCKLLDA